MGLRLGSMVVAVSAVAIVLGAGAAQAAPQHSGSPYATQSPAAASVPAGSQFTSMSPVRVLDTRDGTGVSGGKVAPVGPYGMVRIDLTGKIPVGATAVVLNVTGTDTTTPTYISVQNNPNSPISNLNLDAGETRANAVTVEVGSDPVVTFENFQGNVDLVADLEGYYTPTSGAGFTSMSPTRVLDTRVGTGTGGAVAPVGTDSTLTLDLSGQVPASATAVTLNLTGVDATTDTYLTAWPDGVARPLASSLNLTPDNAVPNQVTVALGTDHKIDLYNFQGTVDLVADLGGYYATGTGNPFYTLTPVRTLDTRGVGAGPVGAGQSTTADLSPWVPSSATAAVFNLTGTDTTTPTYVTAWPAGTNEPLASNLNLIAGQTAANLTTVALGSGGQVAIGNFQGSVDVVVDLAGYFAPPPAPCTSDCALTSGENQYGQLGNGTTTDQAPVLAQVPGLSGVTSVAAGVSDTYALTTDGTVYAWGDNTYQQLGNDSSTGDAPMPAPVAGLPKIIAIAAGQDVGYALDANHTLWAWGFSDDGELGDGNANPGDVPIKVSLPAGSVTAIASTGTTAYALLSDGTVWAWGENHYDGIGNGAGCGNQDQGQCFVNTPVQVASLSNVVAIYAGSTNGFAVESDGSVWDWGWNAEGELGNGTVGGIACYNAASAANCQSTGPIEIPALAGVSKIVGQSNMYAIKPDGTVLAWGDNSFTQIGNGAVSDSSCNVTPAPANCYYPTPFVLSGLSGVKDLGVGVAYAIAVKSDGTVWEWGYGPLRENSTSTPTQVPEPAAVYTIEAGPYHAVFTAKTP